MNITLTPSQLESVLAEAKAEIVKSILTEYRDRITLVSKAQAAGLLNVEGKTLDAIGMPRVVISAKSKIAYRLSDIADFIEANLER